MTIRAVPLEIRPNEDIRTLRDARYTFIQWPKKDIALDPAVPPQLSIQKASPTGPSMTPPQPSRHDHASPTGPSMTPPHISPQKATLSVPVEKTPKEQEKRAAVSGPESSRRKTLPILKAKSKSTNVKAPPKSGKSAISGKYIIGKPLCSAAVLGHAGYACQALHAWYLEKTKEEGCDTGITVRYEYKHFFSETNHFVVGFNDLYDLFNLVGLDASLLRCWTL